MSKDKERVRASLDSELYAQLKYWANRRTNGSVNQYIVNAIELAIRHENKDYDLPTAEVARLNQLVDAVTLLSTNIASLEEVQISGFESLLGLARGDTYLLNEEDGDLDG